MRDRVQSRRITKNLYLDTDASLPAQNVLPQLKPPKGMRLLHPLDMLTAAEADAERETLDELAKTRRAAEVTKGSLRLH